MVLEEVFDRVRSAYTPDSNASIVIGVAGYTVSGKSTFLVNFSDFIKRRGISTTTLSSDLYHVHPRDVKKSMFGQAKSSGANLIDVYAEAYQHDIATMRENLNMVRERRSFSQKALYNGESGQKDAELKIDFSGRGENWTLFEGVYILVPQIRDLVDKVIFLKTTTEERHKRVERRALKRANPIQVDNSIMLAGDEMNRRWLGENIGPTDIIIDNNDYDNPKLVDLFS